MILKQFNYKMEEVFIRLSVTKIYTLLLFHKSEQVLLEGFHSLLHSEWGVLFMPLFFLSLTHSTSMHVVSTMFMALFYIAEI